MHHLRRLGEVINLTDKENESEGKKSQRIIVVLSDALAELQI